MILATGLLVLFALLAIGTPVGFAMAASGALGLYLTGGLRMLSGILQTAPLSTVSAYELITIPMFLLMAEFMVASRISDSLFASIAAWTGRLPGGLGVATAITGAAFGAISGSSTAAWTEVGAA